MSRVQSIEFKGRRVIVSDLTGITQPAEWLAAAAEVARFFTTLPADGSALTLTDVSGTRYNREAIESMKALTKANAPKVKASAVVNTSTMHRAAIGMIALFARRRFEVFETRALALEWLVTQ